MGSLKRVLALSLVLGLAAGCKKTAAPKAEDMPPRLAAAMQINSTEEKDAALQAVALDAASLGLDGVVKQAVNFINTVSLRDETAGECALRLAHTRHVDAARDVAQMINSVELRDATLKKIAEGAQ